MDFSSLKDQVSNLTLYDLKAGVRKVQNAVMNYTEMEAKVREATNNEPWGASSTLMQEIANGTYTYQLLNEIMPMIYKRFTEKSAEEWRQIYKSLQLLEFLIKNGSERVIDDARSHLSLLKMLRQFQYYDQNGKDQGINVRNRAKELADLLSDVDKIRAERKKAKSNRNKFGGVEGGGGSSNFGGIGSSSSSRYGGFGSEDAGYGGYTGGVYGDGGGFGGQESSTIAGGGRRDKFEEYDEGDDAPASTSASRHTRNTSTASTGKRKVEEAKPKAPEIDLFEFGEETPTTMAPPQSAGTRSNATDDDEFDDFISATPAPSSTTATSISSFAPPPAAGPTFAAPKPVSASQASNMSGLANFSSISPAPSAQSSISANTGAFSSPMPAQSNQFSQPLQPFQSQAPKPTGYQAAQPNYFAAVQAQTQAAPASGIARPGIASNNSLSGTKPAAAKASGGGGDAFSNLWSSASTSAGIAKKPTAQGPNLASLAKEKTTAGIWGTASKPAQASVNQGMSAQSRPQQPTSQANQAVGGGLDDLLG